MSSSLRNQCSASRSASSSSSSSFVSPPVDEDAVDRFCPASSCSRCNSRSSSRSSLRSSSRAAKLDLTLFGSDTLLCCLQERIALDVAEVRGERLPARLRGRTPLTRRGAPASQRPRTPRSFTVGATRLLGSFRRSSSSRMRALMFRRRPPPPRTRLERASTRLCPARRRRPTRRRVRLRANANNTGEVQTLLLDIYEQLSDNRDWPRFSGVVHADKQRLHPQLANLSRPRSGARRRRAPLPRPGVQRVDAPPRHLSIVDAATPSTRTLRRPCDAMGAYAAVPLVAVCDPASRYWSSNTSSSAPSPAMMSTVSRGLRRRLTNPKWCNERPRADRVERRRALGGNGNGAPQFLTAAHQHTSPC